MSGACNIHEVLKQMFKILANSREKTVLFDPHCILGSTSIKLLYLRSIMPSVVQKETTQKTQMRI